MVRVVLSRYVTVNFFYFFSNDKLANPITFSSNVLKQQIWNFISDNFRNETKFITQRILPESDRAIAGFKSCSKNS